MMTFCYSNDLQSFDSISFLYLCPKLQTVTFRGNPIADAADYQDRIRRYFPRCPLWIVKTQIVNFYFRLKNLDPMPRKYRSAMLSRKF